MSLHDLFLHSDKLGQVPPGVKRLYGKAGSLLSKTTLNPYLLPSCFCSQTSLSQGMANHQVIPNGLKTIHNNTGSNEAVESAQIKAAIRLTTSQQEQSCQGTSDSPAASTASQEHKH